MITQSDRDAGAAYCGMEPGTMGDTPLAKAFASHRLASIEEGRKLERAENKWQPISSAPKNIQLLVLRRDGLMHVASVSWIIKKFGLMNADFGNTSCTVFFPIDNDYDNADDAPTHWMPLPAPPKETE